MNKMTKKICKICYTSGCNPSIEETKTKEQYRYHWKEKNGDAEISFNAESDHMAIVIIQNIVASGTMHRWKCVKKLVVK